MRIAISGAHSVGKTTLVKAIHEETELPIITEVVRSVAKEYGFPDTEAIKSADLESRNKFQRSVLLQQSIEEGYHRKGFISDRSLLDMVAYSMFYNLPDKSLLWMRELALTRTFDYDLIIYCPIPEGTSPTDDGFRLADSDSQKIIDVNIKSLLIRAHCPILWLTPDRDTWAETSLKHIQNLQTNMKRR